MSVMYQLFSHRYVIPAKAGNQEGMTLQYPSRFEDETQAVDVDSRSESGMTLTYAAGMALYDKVIGEVLLIPAAWS
jgi:hypothetical protein